MFFRQEGRRRGFGARKEEKRGNRKETAVSLHSTRVSFFFSFLDRPKKMFRGKDCCSLAVTIGAGMSLHPVILLHSTRKQCKIGLMALDKYNLSLVMGFLHEEVRWQAILPSSRAKKDVVAPTSTPLPPPPFSLPPPPTLRDL